MRNNNDRIKAWALRLLIYVSGILCLGFGIVTNSRSGLGVGAINTFPYALSQLTPLSLGTCSMLMYFVCAGGQMWVYRRMDGKILLQIPFSFVMGRVIDFFNRILTFRAGSMPESLLILALAVVTTAAGVYLMLTMDLVPNPADGMSRAVGVLLKTELGKGKRIFDLCMISLTAVMSLVFGHRIIGIGIGTVISALTVGRMIQIYNRLMGKRLEEIRERSKREGDRNDKK